MRAWQPLLLLVATLAALPAPAETLLVVRKTDDAVDFVDPGSGLRLASVALGHAPHEVSVSPDGRRAVVSNYGTREQPGSTLSLVDLEQPREVRRIELAPHTRPHGVAWFAPDRVAVTTEGSRHLLVVEPDSGRIVTAIETGQDVSHMVAVSADARRAYVTNIGSGTTTALDLESGRKLADVPTGAGSEALAVTPDGRELWVAARADGHLAIVDTASLEVTARLPLPGIPIRIALTPDGRTALVTCAGSSELVEFDVATRRETRRRKVDVPLAPGAEAATVCEHRQRQRAAGGPARFRGWAHRLRRRDHGRPGGALRRGDARAPAGDRGRRRARRPRRDAADAAQAVPGVRTGVPGRVIDR
jgi:DNA-binding beta-propeller fold protein YncE